MVGSRDCRRRHVGLAAEESCGRLDPVGFSVVKRTFCQVCPLGFSVGLLGGPLWLCSGLRKANRGASRRGGWGAAELLQAGAAFQPNGGSPRARGGA
jgi:hypothetical protein